MSGCLAACEGPLPPLSGGGDDAASVRRVSSAIEERREAKERERRRAEERQRERREEAGNRERFDRGRRRDAEKLERDVGDMEASRGRTPDPLQLPPAPR